jgi:perosamine synthetase
MIPVNEPSFGERELEYVSECVRSGWVSSAGKFIEEFEEKWAAYCGRRYGVAVTSGTTALQLAIACLDLEPNHEVIIPSFTMISCALAVTYNGGVPVLVDADPSTYCMDVTKLEEKITSRTKIIMPVHIYGHPVDMKPILDIAEKYGLAIIEDSAEAHGAEYLYRRSSRDQRFLRCGGFGTMSCFSFYANKLITTGEGGMVLTDDHKLASKARSLRNLCFQSDRRFSHEDLGFNFRMTNLQAALGLAQVERIEEIISRKRQIAQGYTRRLNDVTELQLPVERPWARSVYWMYGIVLSDKHEMDGREFSRNLRERGVDTRPFFLGMHEQPVFKNRGLFLNQRYPVTERLAKRGLYLPTGLALTDDQLEQVTYAVKSVLS